MSDRFIETPVHRHHIRVCLGVQGIERFSHIINGILHAGDLMMIKFTTVDMDG